MVDNEWTTKSTYLCWEPWRQVLQREHWHAYYKFLVSERQLHLCMLMTLMAPSCGDSHVLRRVVDEFIVRDGKRNQLTSSRSSCVLIRMDLPVPVVGSQLSYDQPSMRSLTGFSIPRHFLRLRWPRSRHGLDGRQWNHLLRWFSKIPVEIGDFVESPPRGTLVYGDEFDLGLVPNLFHHNSQLELTGRSRASGMRR